MKQVIKSCADCNLKRVTAEKVICKVTGALLMGKNPGEPDYISTKGIHPDCKMLTEQIILTLDAHVKRANGGTLEAFLGNRVMLQDRRKGLVVGKYRNAVEAGLIGIVPDNIRECAWYRVLLDGRDDMLVAAMCIMEIISEAPKYNFNPEFPFYFGFDEDED